MRSIERNSEIVTNYFYGHSKLKSKSTEILELIVTWQRYKTAVTGGNLKISRENVKL